MTKRDKIKMDKEIKKKFSDKILEIEKIISFNQSRIKILKKILRGL